MWRSLLAGCLCLCFPLAAAGGKQPDRKGAAPVFKVQKHLMAAKVGFDKRGRCQVRRGRALKAWRVPSFPASIPHFESCLIVSSPSERGLMDFEMAVVDGSGEKLLLVEGAIELGHAGSASQAVDWDHLVIPAAGLYHMVVWVEGQEIGRFPMRFTGRKGKN
jgi:hypothetical protein